MGNYKMSDWLNIQEQSQRNRMLYTTIKYKYGLDVYWPIGLISYTLIQFYIFFFFLHNCLTFKLSNRLACVSDILGLTNLINTPRFYRLPTIDTIFIIL